MKRIFNIIIQVFSLVMIFSACDKVDDLPFYTTGNGVVLTSSATAITPVEADSANNVLTFSWGDTKLAVDSAHSKYVLELDKVGNNFAQPVKRVVYGVNSVSFLGKELNGILYNTYGAEFATAYDFEARLTSSYANNNDAKISNTVGVKLTPYAKLQSPESGVLWITGDAAGGWSNVLNPLYQFTKIDDKHYTLTTDLKGKQGFLILTQDGSWDKKYNVADNTVPYLNEGGDFGYNLPKDFPALDRDGKYKFDVDFNTGKFTITQIGALVPPDQLVLVGGATPGDWANNADNPQKFTKTADPNVFEITIELKANSAYLMIPNPGSWDNKYGASAPPTPLRGKLYANGDASDIPSPAEAGTYKITADFNAGTFKLEKQ